MAGIETTKVQGLLASAYGHMPHSAYLLLGVGDPAGARRWLGSIVADVTTAAGKQEVRPCLNVAFTWAGLRALGLGDDALRTFPRALQEGMVTEYRSRILGDTGDSAPSQWRWGGPHTDEVHVLLMVFARTEDGLERECQRHRAAFNAGGALHEVADSVLGGILDGGREHFGFADGISQPALRGCGNEPEGPAAQWAVVEPGEFVLGYRDNYGRPAEGPSVATGSDSTAVLPRLPRARQRSDLGRNGSYLVLRQLAQDVPAFHSFVAQAAGGNEVDPERRQRVAAELVGRWPSGAPLALTPDKDNPDLGRRNDFGYHQFDQDGIGCPLGAHIRRANPRDSSRKHPAETLRSVNNHRLLRRGRPYGLPIADPPRSPGEEETAERGLLFLCLNGDIERQFEFVQHTWLNNPEFAGLAGEVDPLLGDPGPGGGRFTEQREPVRRRLHGLSRFVAVKGGAYFFMPGIPALRYLAQLQTLAGPPPPRQRKEETWNSHSESRSPSRRFSSSGAPPSASNG